MRCSIFYQSVFVVLITSTFIFISSCKKDKDISNDNNNYIKDENIKDNVVLIDENIATLLSDSIQQSYGEYIFSYNGTPPSIKPGDVIVGKTGIGYLRKVTSVQVSGNNIALHTQQANMEDLYRSSQLDFDLPFNTKTGNSKSFIAQGVLQNKGDGINLSLSDLTIYSNDNVEVKIVNAAVNINPNFTYSHNFTNGSLEELSVTSENTKIRFDYNASINGTVTENGKFEKLLFEKSTIYITPTIIPIVIGVNHKVKLVFQPTLNVGIDYNFHEMLDYNYDLGARYSKGSFSAICNQKSANESIINNSLDVRSGGSMQLTLVYEPTVYVFGIRGPYLINNLNGIVSGAINTSHDWNAALDASGSTTAGIDFTVFNESGKMEYTQYWFNKRLYTVPDNAVVASGDNQSGYVNSELPFPVKVKVTDAFGFGTPNVKVYFIPVANSGTTTNDYIYTDGNGFAETRWTLGSTEGNQQLMVLVKNGDGSYVNNIPLAINALIVDDFFTDPRDGQQYPYKRIGTQVWMTKNLNYNSLGSWCYNDISENCSIYGKLYEGNAALSVAPPGWHVPSFDEWNTLINYLGGETEAAPKLKSQSLWVLGNGTNSSGFNALPSGKRNYFAGPNGLFDDLGFGCGFWSSTEDDINPETSLKTIYIGICVNYPYEICRGSGGKTDFGLSIRCIKD